MARIKDNRFNIAYSAVTIIIAINIAVYVLQLIFPYWFTDLFILDSSKLLIEPWRLLSSMFLHSPGDPWHIVFNMMWLFFLGPMLEARIGKKRFLLVYIGSGILAGIGAGFFYPRALGASGAIMGMIGTTIILIPRQIIYLNFMPVPLWLAGIVFTIVDSLGIFIPSNTGNIAHLIGLGVGLIYGLTLKSENKIVIKKFKKKSHLDDNDMEEYMRSGRL
jgi:uncharacterized protein